MTARDGIDGIDHRVFGGLMASFLCAWDKLKFLIQFLVIPQTCCRQSISTHSYATEDWADTGCSMFNVQIAKFQAFGLSCRAVLGFETKSP